jgi:hypothetical protein
LGHVADQTFDCPRNMAFNPVTNSCDLPRTNPICRTRQFDCNFVGQMGAWRANPNLFYICLSESGTLFPVIYRCGPRQIFQNDRCVAVR